MIIYHQRCVMRTVREVIVVTLSSFDITFDRSLVEEIEAEVARICHGNPIGLAYTIARNKSADIVKQRISAKKRMARILLREERDRKKAELLAILKKEFVARESDIMALTSSRTMRTTRRNIDLCYLRAMEGRGIAEIQEKFFPELSQECIRKGVSRGRKLFLKQFISSQLREKLTVGHQSMLVRRNK